jgi:hypothetical protein
VAHVIDGLINRSVDFFVTNVPDPRRAPIQEILALLGHNCAALGGRNLLRRNSHDADFLVGRDWPAQDLLDSPVPDRWPFESRQFAWHESPAFDRTKKCNSSVRIGTG